MKKSLRKYIFFLIGISFIFTLNVSGKINAKSINPIAYYFQNNLLLEHFEMKSFADKSIICGGRTGIFLKEIFHLTKFIVPIIIIGFGLFDFIKAITAQSQDEIKKAMNKLVKRLIIGICIFVLPTVLDFLLKLADINSELCGW